MPIGSERAALQALLGSVLHQLMTGRVRVGDLDRAEPFDDVA